MKTLNLKKIYKSFSLTEKVIFSVFLTTLAFSLLVILNKVNQQFLVEVPVKGGELTEGVVGTPRLINPLIAVSETDRSLSKLVYSGLLRKTVVGLESDLAEKYEISEDGLEYHFYIKENAEFHDGKSITSDDVIFTILAAQNPELSSPKRSNWEGVGIEKINDKEIIFRLEEPYEPFLENMTLGILPRHIWEEIDINEFTLSKFNTEAIGSGPYKISDIKRDSIGIPTKYTLEAFKKYSSGRPKIDEIIFKFYKNQELLMEGYEKNEVDSVYGIDPDFARDLQIDGERIETFTLPRIFGVFFNQNESAVLAENEVRQALKLATPKIEVVDNVLSGFGTVIESTIPQHILKASVVPKKDVEAANKILLDNGWKLNENGIYENEDGLTLEFDINTSNINELSETAKIISNEWREIGVNAEVKTFESSDLNPSVIRPRKFAALLFGIVVSKEMDLYAFWHSSQRDDPGLNITSYANITADNLLTEIRENPRGDEVNEKLTLLDEEISTDIPAIFLYSPEFIYVLPDDLKGLEISNLMSSEDRFMNVHKWYLDTDKVWRIFIN